MGLRHSRKARRRSRSIRLSGFEPLESRTLLAGDAANTFAVFDGSLTQPDEARPIEIAIRPEDFALPAGGATLGFLLASAGGSGLDPAPVQIQDAGGTPVVPQFVAPDLAGNSQSLVLAGSALRPLSPDRRRRTRYHRRLPPPGAPRRRCEW